MWQAMNLVRDKTKEMSLFKCCDIVRTYLRELRKCVFSSANKFFSITQFGTTYTGTVLSVNGSHLLAKRVHEIL